VTQFLDIMPVLRVADLRRSIDWYVEVLGFRPHGRSPDDGDGEHGFIQAGEAELLLSTGSHLGGPPSFTGTLYFRVVGVDALYDKVRGRAEVVWPLEQQEYGTREFGIRDPDGYVLAFAEESAPSDDPGGPP
jgi:catechol 2,3-dioxygenase-like lactoylglutathione lyase family enzyme